MSVPLRFTRPDEPVAFLAPSIRSKIDPELIRAARREAESMTIIHRRGHYKLYAVRLAGGDLNVVFSAGSSTSGPLPIAQFRLADDRWIQE